MQDIIVTQRGYLRWFFLVGAVLCIFFLYIFIWFGPYPNSAVWESTLIAGICGTLFACLGSFCILGVFYAGSKDAAVLKDQVVGIIQDGGQRIVPLAAVSDVKITGWRQYLILKNQSVKIFYNFQGQKKSVTLWEIYLFGLPLLNKNFEIFLTELEARRTTVPYDKWAEATQVKEASSLKIILMGGILTLLIAVPFTYAIYLNESGRRLITTHQAPCLEVVENKNRKSGCVDYRVIFEFHGKKMDLHYTHSHSDDASIQLPRVGDMLTIEEWKGGVWGGAFRVQKDSLNFLHNHF